MAKVDKVQAAKNRARLKSIAAATASAKANAKVQFEADTKRKELLRKKSKYDNRGFNDKQTGSQITSGYFADTMPKMSLGYFEGTVLDGTNKVIQNKKVLGANGKYYPTKAEALKNNKQPSLQSRIPNGSPKDQDIKNFGYFGPADNSVTRSRNNMTRKDIIRKPVESGKLGLSKRTVETGLNKGKDMMLMDYMTNTSNQRNPRNSDITVRTSTVGNKDTNPYFGKPVIDYKGGEIQYNNINPMDLGGYNQETKRKVSFAISRGTDTLTGMNLTNNYANPNFGASNPARVSKAVQSAQSKGAADGLQNLIKFGVPKGHVGFTMSTPKGGQFTPGVGVAFGVTAPGASTHTNTYMGALPPSINRSVTRAVTAPVISSYGNFANPAFSAGVKAKATISKPTMTQAQFSQNIKLISGGFSLNDSAARESIAKSSAGSAARLKLANRRNVAATLENLKSDPNIAEANRILAEQGADYRYEIQTVRRSRHHWVATVLTVHAGPTIYSSYTYTNSRGNSQRQIQNNTYAGDRVGGKPSYQSVVDTYYKQKAVAQFGRDHTELKQVGTDAQFAGRVEALASSRKPIIDQYLEPFESIYSYATITNAEVGDITQYGSALTKNVGEYDANIDILNQGITKVNVARGKAPAARKAGFFGPTAYDAIEAREKPFDLTIADTSKSLGNVSTQLSGKQKILDTRNSLTTNVNRLMDSGLIPKMTTISVDETITAIDSNLARAEAAVVSTETAWNAFNAQRWPGNRSGNRAKEQQLNGMINTWNSAKANVSSLQSTKAQLQQSGAIAFGDDKINAGVIATPGNLSIRGAATGRRNWYYGTSGSTTIHIPKDKIPASGKVTVEATISYTSGYKGPTHADTTLGRVQGSATLKKELPVDANGNITISATMYGVNRGQDASASISGIKIFDPTTTKHGAQLYGDIDALTTTQSNLSKILQENQGTKSYFDNAQLFLTGKSSELKDTTGKAVANFSGGNLNILDQDQFKGMFGSNFDSESFAATRDVYVPLNTLLSKKQTTTAEKQSILAREATRGEVLSAETKASLTSQANSLKSQAASLSAQASVQAAIAANNPWHSKIEIWESRKAQNAAAAQAAASLSGQAASLNAQAKQKEIYRDTGIDPTRPLPDAVKSQVSALDMQLGTIALTESFLTGKSNKLVINDLNVASRDQGGKITVSDANYFANLGLNVAPITKQGVAPPNTKKFAALEQLIEDRDKQQKQLIEQLKVVQTERITEQAEARVQQINELIRKRAIGRRDASKMKLKVAQETNAQRAAVKGVDDSIPLPDITVFDADLRSEAQQILDSTGGMVTGIKKSNTAGRLRQVTRSRKPQGSVIGEVLARGSTVPRPPDEFQNRQTSTTLGSQNARIRNPFIGG